MIIIVILICILLLGVGFALFEWQEAFAIIIILAIIMGILLL